MSADSDASLREHRKKTRKKDPFDSQHFSFTPSPGDQVGVAASPAATSSLEAAEEKAKQLDFDTKIHRKENLEYRVWREQYLAALEDKMETEGVSSFKRPPPKVLRLLHKHVPKHAVKEPKEALEVYAHSVNQPIHIEPPKKSQVKRGVSLLTKELMTRPSAPPLDPQPLQQFSLPQQPSDKRKTAAAQAAAQAAQRADARRERESRRIKIIDEFEKKDKQLAEVGARMQENNSARTAACKQCDVLLKEKAQLDEEFENLLTTRDKMAKINSATRGGKKRKTKKRKTKKRKTKKRKSKKTKKHKTKKRKSKKHKSKKHKTKKTKHKTKRR